VVVRRYIVSFLNSIVSLCSLRNIKKQEKLQILYNLYDTWTLDGTPLEMLVWIGQKFNFSMRSDVNL